MGAVRLMTAHKSKGMEFEHVYVAQRRRRRVGRKERKDVFELPVSGERVATKTSVDLLLCGHSPRAKQYIS